MAVHALLTCVHEEVPHKCERADGQAGHGQGHGPEQDSVFHGLGVGLKSSATTLRAEV